MQVMFSRLWNDQDGAILSAEVVVVASVLVIGVIVGLSAVRDAVVSELADVAQAIGNLNQSYSLGGIQGHHSYSVGGSFHDLFDFCDTADATASAQSSKCVSICSAVAICNGSSDGLTFAAP